MDVANENATFKVPSKPAPKRKRVVMDEDSFIAEMEKIIEADFFPDLKSLRLKNDYLEALDNEDYDGMRRAYVSLKRHREARLKKKTASSAPGTPAHFADTPSSTASRRSDFSEFDAEEVALGFSEETPRPGEEEDIEKEMEAEHPVALILRKDAADERERERRKTAGLDAFLENHVSEDTESFKILMDKADAERRRKKAWMFDPPSRPGETTPEERLALPSIEEQADQVVRPTNIDHDLCPVYNPVMFVPEGRELTGKEKLAMERPVIRHGSTRFKGNPFNAVKIGEKDAAVLYKRSGNKGEKIGVDGKLENEDKDDGGVPQMGGAPRFDFISTPRIRPDDIDSPLMTWGQVVGTPLLLEGPSRAGTPSFRMAPTPKRDQLAEKLVQRSKASHSRPTTPRIGSKSSKSSFLDSPGAKRLSTMSPAAHHLMTRKLGITPKLGSGSKSGTGSLTPRGDVRRTPTPRRNVGVTLARTPTPRKVGSTSDAVSKDHVKISKRIAEGQAGSSLTDNLLNLPS